MQTSSNEAMMQLEGMAYASERDLAYDKSCFMKKMRLSKEDLNSYLKRLEKSHTEYKSELWLIKFLSKIKHFKNKWMY